MERYGGPLKNEKQNYYMIQQLHFWVDSKEVKAAAPRDTRTPTCTAALFMVVTSVPGGCRPKQNVVATYSGVLVSLQRERSSDTYGLASKKLC